MNPIFNNGGFIATHPLTRDQKLRAFGRVIRWQIESRLRDEIIVSWIGDTRLAARRGMAGATGNIYCGLHEFADMAFLLHFLRPGDVFTDIGANIGSYSILASGVCKATSFAFEPDPAAFAALSRNIALNRLQVLVRGHQFALGAQRGSVDFTVGLDTVNHVATAADAAVRSVVQDTLDHALADCSAALIKLDVEGYEDQVLLGATETLKRPELRAIIIEDRSPPVVDTLSAAGFVEYVYDPFSRSLVLPKNGSRRQNGLFLRDLENVRKKLTTASRFEVLNRSI